jgi:hypothetical protein
MYDLTLWGSALQMHVFLSGCLEQKIKFYMQMEGSVCTTDIFLCYKILELEMSSDIICSISFLLEMRKQETVNAQCQKES